uniref:Uncharacterized protein n=1 Tax=Arundo donax TaxID=35708 RepID=A0A0A8YL87_ARUDO
MNAENTTTHEYSLSSFSAA